MLAILALGASASGQSTWYVDDDAAAGNGGTSWADALPDLQAALGLAQAGDQVWVAVGTYTPDPGGLDRTRSFELQSGVALYGGFDGNEATLAERAGRFDETILSGDLAGDDAPGLLGVLLLTDPSRADNSEGVVSAVAVDATALLDGFTIADGAGNLGGGLFLQSSSLTISDCTLRHNAAGSGGGMYVATSSLPRLTRVRFLENYGAQGGGMSTRNASRPELTDCLFQRNVAGGAGGGMNNVGDIDARLVRCRFLFNRAGSFGGAMTNEFQSEPYIEQCLFEGNRAGARGGAMYNVLAVEGMTLIDCDFILNYARSNGGAISNRTTCNPLIEDCRFINNESRDGGGIFNLANCSPTVNRCLFEGNRAQVIAGGMANVGFSNPVITDTVFRRNSTEERGGGMTNLGSNPTVTRCTFEANHAGFWGGGMRSGVSTSVQMSDCLFLSNSAPEGGGLSLSGSATEIRDTRFVRNIATERGGAIQAIDSDFVMQDCSLEGNEATLAGGGIDLEAISAPLIERTTLRANRVLGRFGRGGGLHADQLCEALVIDSEITENHSTFRGGGLSVSSDGRLTLRSCRIERNHADLFGGGLSADQEGALTVVGSTVEGNLARAGAGADLYTEARPRIVGSLFLDNEADEDGGGVRIAASAGAHLAGNVFNANRARRGAGLFNDRFPGPVPLGPSSSVDLVQCTFHGGRAATGGGLFNGLGASLVATNCIVWDATGGAIVGDLPLVDYSIVEGGFPGIDNLVSDPLFTNPLGADGLPGTADDDLRPAGGSPAVDSGLDAALPQDEADADDDADLLELLPIDFDGRPRQVGTAVDRGAHEWPLGVVPAVARPDVRGARDLR